MLPEELLATIENRCRSLGLSEGEFSRAVAGHKSVLTDLRRGRSPSLERLRKIFEVLGLKIYVGLPRDPLLANFARALREADSRDDEIAALTEAMEIALPPGRTRDVWLDRFKSPLLLGTSPQPRAGGVSDDHAITDLLQTMREAGWSDHRIAALRKAMELAFPEGGAGSSGFLIGWFQYELMAEIPQQHLLPAVEDGAQALNRAIIDAGGDPIPDDLWPVLASRRENEVSLPSNKKLPLGAQPVEVVELAMAEGGGTDVRSEEVVGNMWFRRDWFDGRGLDPSRCVVVRATGESMEPLLCEGAPILVDQERRRRIENRIFVVRTDDGIIAKRAGRDSGGRWQLVSEHPSWAPVSWPKDAETIGQAIWTARSLI